MSQQRWLMVLSVILLSYVAAEGFLATGGSRVTAAAPRGFGRVVVVDPRLLLLRSGDAGANNKASPLLPLPLHEEDAKLDPKTVKSLETTTPIRTTTANKKTGNQQINGQKQHHQRKKSMELMWCGDDMCMENNLREQVVADNQIVLTGPATGQVAYIWNHDDVNDTKNTATVSVLMLVKKQSDASHLLEIAANCIKRLTTKYPKQLLRILLDPDTAAKLCHYHAVDSTRVELFEQKPCPGFGENPSERDIAATEFKAIPRVATKIPDLICTLGGDGLLMHAAMLFQGPVPPILCVSGGSLGFLTTIQPEEMTEALEISLGLVSKKLTANGDSSSAAQLQVFPPNMPVMETSSSPDSNNESSEGPHQICVSIRMRLDCRIINRDGTVRARYNVLNEVVIDRGSSPYLAALECFCDNVHLTTVQADGVIFATPTGSTAYSLAAGSSVVHPAVPSILVTPICPHVLSFRPMVFPDHVVLRCFVPDDARSEASIAFDGKHRQSLRRGESVQIRLSAYPVSTINRQDHSSDWLDSLKRNFNFNSRPRQGPL